MSDTKQQKIDPVMNDPKVKFALRVVQLERAMNVTSGAHSEAAFDALILVLQEAEVRHYGKLRYDPNTPEGEAFLVGLSQQVEAALTEILKEHLEAMTRWWLDNQMLTDTEVKAALANPVLQAEWLGIPVIEQRMQ